MFRRHVDRAVEALQEADRLLKGAVGDMVARCVAFLEAEAAKVGKEEGAVVRFAIADLPPTVVPYLDNPFAASLRFNLHCQERGESHTQGAKSWTGGAAAVAARNLMFLPPAFAKLWDEGMVDKTRLVAIANRNLKPQAYDEIAELVRTRRREDVDERLLRIPPAQLQVGRRGPEQAMEAAASNGWLTRLATVELAEELVKEASSQAPEGDEAAGAPAEATPAEEAARTLRAGLGGAAVSPEVLQALRNSPDPATLVERFLTGHRQSGDPEPTEITQTIFFAHAGPMHRIIADDKLLLRHFRPVKTQKRGQLFYRVLEAVEEAILERAHQAELAARGITEEEATQAVRRIIVDLNKDANRYLEVPEVWLGEVTRRHLYFGSRTRKEGAAYKWFRRIGERYYVGGHKTQEEVDERDARRASRSTS